MPFALSVATAGAALGSLSREEFIEMMGDVWDKLDKQVGGEEEPEGLDPNLN